MGAHKFPTTTPVNSLNQNTNVWLTFHFSLEENHTEMTLFERKESFLCGIFFSWFYKLLPPAETKYSSQCHTEMTFFERSESFLCGIKFCSWFYKLLPPTVANISDSDTQKWLFLKFLLESFLWSMKKISWIYETLPPAVAHALMKY